jgi:glyoxylase-like metal-dependent hydrolase (beta-lactamase superfamily II)
MQFGDFELHSLHENDFWIDGGVMYGVVPRVLWEKLSVPDERNRVALRANLLLIKAGEENILVESGLGNDLPERWKENFGLKEPSRLSVELAGVGLSPEDIDQVILTHLHSDHSGGCVRRQGDRFVPVFPNAQHVVQKNEWHYALDPDVRSRVSYIKEMLLPLEEHGLLRLVDGDAEISPGIQLKVTGGHTGGHQVVMINSQDRRSVYTGDLIPTASHLRTAYVASVDLYPMESMKAKGELIEKVIAEHWLVFFGHDTRIDAGYLKRGEKRRVEVEEVEVQRTRG